MVSVEHRFDGIQVVLQVGIDADHDVAVGREQARQQGVLVTAVAGELDAANERVSLRKRLDQRPRPVLAAVVDEVDGTAGGHFASGPQAVEHLAQPA